MDHGREEHNPQRTRGRNGVGSSRKRNRDTSEGDVPKQEEPKRGRPRLELTDEQKKKKKEERKESCKKYRQRKNDEFQRLQNFENEYRAEFESWSPKSLKVELLRLQNIENMLLEIFENSSPEILKGKLHELQDFKREFQEEFGSSRPKSLKETNILREILPKLGVPEEVLEGLRKGTSCEELGKVCQTSKDKIPAQKEILHDKMEEDLSDGCGLWYHGPSATMNEPIKQDTAGFSRYQHTEIKQETMPETFEVTEEGLEDKGKRTLNSEERLEEHTKILSEDETTEESLEGDEKLAKTMEFGALIHRQSTTLGSEKVAMNELFDLDDLLTNDDGKDVISWLNTAQVQGSDDAAVDEPMDWDKFPPVDDWLASKSGEKLQ